MQPSEPEIVTCQATSSRRTNQNFVAVPYARLIALLTYKAERVCIRVIVREEAYTSKCSFVDDEPIGHHERYAGRRVHRGLFRTASGRYLNADVNGSYNILAKAAPEAFALGRRGCVVQPVRLELPIAPPPARILRWCHKTLDVGIL
jgi:putative transposase